MFQQMSVSIQIRNLTLNQHWTKIKPNIFSVDFGNWMNLLKDKIVKKLKI